MSFFEAILLGLVEGVTEFLPISSTAHLILTSQLLGIPYTEYLGFFEVLIQSGAILAVLVLFWRVIFDSHHTLSKLALAFVPTALVGFVMQDTIKEVFFQSNALIGWSLVLVGVVFVVVERFVASGKLNLNKTLAEMTYFDAFLIGLIQSVAIVPGVSRAGAVIIIMMLLRYKRSEAALFSFLLAVPTVLGAGILDIYATDLSIISQQNYLALALGCIVAFVSAYLLMKWLITYLRNNTLMPFAIYRIVVGLIVLLLV
jgi:undecaprenyl-diphosphatase